VAPAADRGAYSGAAVRTCSASSTEAKRLLLNMQPFLKKQLDRIGDGIESLYLEVQDMTAYERVRVRQEHQEALWLQRRVEVCIPLLQSSSLYAPKRMFESCPWCKHSCRTFGMMHQGF
jgi:hypothetical protein